MHYVETSREALADVLVSVGPDADTLCEGWKSRHLSAHLLIRENSALSAGIFLPLLRGPMENRLEQLADAAQDLSVYLELVDRFRAGPIKFSPFRIRQVNRTANLLEYFVHTEDVRRARSRWAPRHLDEDYVEALWSDLTHRAKFMYAKSPVGVILVRRDGTRFVAKRAANSVAVIGHVGELVMHSHGRQSHALVTLEGSPESIKILTGLANPLD
ncbi:TIGR03085 family metal-binding protein [Neomicrococcus lactis]|uniref:Uncharacterized protein (TIGR03085 family) n=1 Tax=Neomicrococcus lactis TaxID=732241 RepID=A0A7W8Y9E5_9MICC|nr:TIGR03085 family metal-binding protein [Neomicrococcus lactis]MBB5597369.1 uncharacterized protein (TIGR03085 family) [Neomicrococcus lactis]